MELINSTLGKHSVSHSTVKKWFSKFHDGNFTLEDDPRRSAVKEKLEDVLQVLLDENPCQNQEELQNSYRNYSPSDIISIACNGKDDRM
ncbi:hypothetical protein TNCT_277451 [Trichonephila clavata]|uniref:Mos1 transposase HTH domain-containing protein n=1 Tax=Trichonephila clavata TaxID=2740835 RepID=A0A8X6KV99_TRICU|nr:hypothetical protein TNCT_277451 [Trichonephila clavata]